MKLNHMTLLAAMACGLMATHVRAQTQDSSSTFRRSALTYDYYRQEGEAQPSPSDIPVEPAPSCEVAAACDTCCETDCDTCDPWRLFPEMCGWQLYGFINGSANANASSPPSGFNGPVTFLDQEQLMLNQFYVTLERVANTCGCGFDWGGRVDLLYGTDYVFTQAAGLELQQNGDPHWNGARNDYGLAMPQIYGEVAYNDLSIKLGHFYTIMGYQVVPATGNFFITQPYTFQYGEPFTHTGALASWKYSDQLTLYGGVVNGWDKFDAVTDRAAGLGGLLYAPDHGRYSIFLTGIAGEEDGINAAVQGRRTLYSLVFTYNITDDWQYVFQHDNGQQENGVAPGVDAEWYGVNQYLFYTVNECWKLGGRFEWFRDDDGTRLAAAPVRLGGLANLGVAGLPAAAAGNYYQLALGANWTPHANLIVRPEVRWDWSDGTAIAPYDDLNKDSQFIAAVDAILLF
jgi:hypothetical protein